MSKKIAYFLAFCVVSMGLVTVMPSAGADVVAVNIQTHRREGDWWSGYTYPPDDYFRTGENEFWEESEGYDDVYYSFRAVDGTDPYEGYIYVEMLAPSTTRVYEHWFTLVLADGGIYNSYEHDEYWDVDESGDPELGAYELNIWNATDIIGTKTFEVYEPTEWTATVEIFEDPDLTIPANMFPPNSNVYYTVHIEDEYGGPLYYRYEYENAYSYAVHDGDEYYLDSMSMDWYGNYDESFDISSSWELGDWVVRIRYPSTSEAHNIPTPTPFTVYEPLYTATIKTYIEGYETETSIYSIDDRVYWTAHIEDQYNRNLTQGTLAYVQLEHRDSIWRYWDSAWVDDYGNASDSFWLSSTSWKDDDQIGLYTLRLSDDLYGDPFLGSTDFEVISIKITPEKEKYAQGEEITITVTTEIYQSDINITIFDEEWSVIDSWQEQSMTNKIWTTTYTLSDTIPDGKYLLSVNESGTDRPLGGIEFNVKKYTLQIWPDAGAYLPGETMTVYYTVTSNKDGSGVSGTKIEWAFRYYDTDEDDWDSFSEDFTDDDASGNFNIIIPESASIIRDANLYVWANDTSDRSDYKYKNIEIGGIDAEMYIGEKYVDDEKFLAGDFVVVTVEANIEGSPLKNGDVSLKVSKDGIEISAYTKDNLKTDSQGKLKYIFALQSNAEVGQYRVAINVSKLNEWDTAQETFEVVENRELSLKLGFDNKYFSDWEYPQYYSGDTVTVTYTALRGEDIVENVNCEYYVRYNSNYISAGTTSTGEFTFDIPEDFEGILEVYVLVTDSEGNKANRPAHVDVDRAGLLLKPNMNQYLPGNTIRISYTVVGAEIPNAAYYYEVKDGDNIVKREDLTSPSGEFQFTVPEANVPDRYTIIGYITDSNGVNLARSSVQVTRLRGFMLTFTLDKKTYRPGETATLNYKITSVDGSEIPEKFTLNYGFLGGPSRSIQTSKAEGSLKVKVPEDAADGVGYFIISPSGLPATSAQQQANIRENPNPFAETVGDMSLLELILLVLVIISLIIGIVGWKRGKKALDEAKLPPWKKERPLPEPEKFKESEEPALGEEAPSSVEEEIPPPPENVESVPPKDMPSR